MKCTYSTFSQLIYNLFKKTKYSNIQVLLTVKFLHFFYISYILKFLHYYFSVNEKVNSYMESMILLKYLKI